MEGDTQKRCPGCMRIRDWDGRCSYCHFEEKKYHPNPCCLSLGTLLKGRYQLGRVLGEGGFGITYIGWDQVLAMPVAVKEYYPEGIVGRDVTLRGDGTIHIHEGQAKEVYQKGLDTFLEEARMLSQFSQMEGVVTVRDFFQENQTAYIVMEYVDGTSVKEYVQKYGQIEPQKVLCMMEPVIRSLQKVHEHQLIHRDISADNLMITKEGHLKLIDFGAARVFRQDSQRTMTVVFKRGFAAPEQYHSKGKQGSWTDIYGICATMYYMMTGIVPEESIGRMVNDQVIPLAKFEGIELPESVSGAIDKGMEVQEDRRWQCVSELYSQIYRKEVSSEDTDIWQKTERHGHSQGAGNRRGESRWKSISYTSLMKQWREMSMEEQHNSMAKKIKIWLSLSLGVMIFCFAGIGVYSLWGERTKAREPLATPLPVQSQPMVQETPTPSPNTRQVPDVKGKRAKVAEEMLQKLNLQVEVVKKYHDKIEKGYVIRQSISAGKEVSAGQKVVLYVSRGKKPKTTPEPVKQTPTAKPAATPKADSKTQSSPSGEKKESDDAAGSLDGILP